MSQHPAIPVTGLGPALRRAAIVLASLTAFALLPLPFERPARSAEAVGSKIERGRYLVAIAGCGDCHTAGYFFGRPDMQKPLSGSDVGFEIKGLGVFFGSNLTPDDQSGLGRWSESEIVRAITTGVRPDGRELAPAMPWRGLSALSPADAQAIAAYLKSLPPTRRATPGPFGPNESATAPVLTIRMPGG